MNNQKWIIIREGFYPRPCDDCEMKEKQSTLMIDNEQIDKNVCRKHAENYKFVGQWSRTWRKFPVKNEWGTIIKEGGEDE